MGRCLPYDCSFKRFYQAVGARVGIMEVAILPNSFVETRV